MSLSKHEKAGESLFYRFFLTYIPNRRDNVRQLVLKSFFLLVLIAFTVSATLLSLRFLSDRHQHVVLDRAKEIWYAPTEKGDPTPFETLQTENGDLKGWIKIPGTQIDAPFYQTTDNVYYLDHNLQKETSRYGALFLDCENKLSDEYTDRNLVLYGHNMRDGAMFGSLKNLRTLSFYREHHTVELTTATENKTYIIYAVFLLNARKEDDDGYRYNIFRNRFLNETDFEAWVKEAEERSLIQTGVEVSSGDPILTLVTGADDFEDARLVVMARELRQDDSPFQPADALPNPSPRYPKRWYDDRKLPYPYSGGRNDVS